VPPDDCCLQQGEAHRLGAIEEPGIHDRACHQIIGCKSAACPSSQFLRQMAV
jgi:hypothetical protein